VFSTFLKFQASVIDTVGGVAGRAKGATWKDRPFYSEAGWKLTVVCRASNRTPYLTQPLVVEGEPTGHLPADPVTQRSGGVAIGESLKRLENHDRGHHVSGDRGTPSSGAEQVLEHVIGEQLVAVVRQERLDASFGNELTTQCCRVEELTAGIAMALHLPILGDRHRNREHRSWISSTVS
jgi:hypothetical protein